MQNNIRTDLALEAKELWETSQGAEEIPGVSVDERGDGSFRITEVRIEDLNGEKALCKPVGKYITFELDGLIKREENAFEQAASLLSSEIRRIMPLMPDATVLVAGLGNDAITPDAIGPECLRSVLVTRHLKERMPGDFSFFRNVAAVEPGVLGTTGMESADIVSALVGRIAPDAVIAIDALASREPDRLCRTVQLADTGITPGSGVGNRRAELSRGTLGIPVLAIGVPTVVDSLTLTAVLAEKAGIDLPDDDTAKQKNMMVTPKDIDRSVRDISRLIGYALDLALHDGLTIPDIDMFLG